MMVAIAPSALKTVAPDSRISCQNERAENCGYSATLASAHSAAYTVYHSAFP